MRWALRQHPALNHASAAATMTINATIAAGARFRDDSRSRGRLITLK